MVILNGKEGATDCREKQHVATTVAPHFKSLTALWGLFYFDIDSGQQSVTVLVLMLMSMPLLWLCSSSGSGSVVVERYGS